MIIIKNSFCIMNGYNDSYISDEFCMIGHKYLYTKTYTPIYKEVIMIGYNNMFTKLNRYELLSVNNLSATFIGNGGIRYFLKTYVYGELFKHFDFNSEYNNYISDLRINKIDSILNVEISKK